jgi:hypothetical protein
VHVAARADNFESIPDIGVAVTGSNDWHMLIAAALPDP